MSNTDSVSLSPPSEQSSCLLPLPIPLPTPSVSTSAATGPSSSTDPVTINWQGRCFKVMGDLAKPENRDLLIEFLDEEAKRQEQEKDREQDQVLDDTKSQNEFSSYDGGDEDDEIDGFSKALTLVICDEDDLVPVRNGTKTFRVPRYLTKGHADLLSDYIQEMIQEERDLQYEDDDNFDGSLAAMDRETSRYEEDNY